MAAWGYEFYLQHSKIKFVSPRGHEISSISFNFFYVNKLTGENATRNNIYEH